MRDMPDPNNEVPVVNDVVITEDEDQALDDSINGDIAKIRAENGVETKTPTAEKSAETPSAEAVETPKPEDTQANEDHTETIDFTQPPNRGKTETDESYTMRLHLFDLVRQKKAAGTQVEKDAISTQMDSIRTEIRELARQNNKSSLSDTNNDATPESDTQKPPESPADTRATVQEIIAEERRASDIRSVADNFFSKHAVFKDVDAKAVFMDFFDQNYKIDGKTPAQIAQTLELAQQAMFRPNESVQERVLKGAGVQEKVNAMQFPGGSIVRENITPEQQKSIDEIVATGKMSVEKARELILED